MPLTAKGKKLKAKFREQYERKKGTQFFTLWKILEN